MDSVSAKDMATCKSSIVNKIKNKTAKVGVIGLGYVGLPLVLRCAESSFVTCGFDIDITKVDLLNKNQSYIKHISSDQLIACTDYFTATNEFSKIAYMDVIIICVPTPLTKNREPDLTYIINTMHAIAPYLRAEQLLSLESTTYPGTTEEVLAPIIAETGLAIGDNFFLVFSPEREDPANPEYHTKIIPKICGGQTAACLAVGKTFYESIVNTVVTVSSTKAAEMTKILENIHRAVNIGLVNEMKMVADRMGIDIHEVINAAATKPFGFVPYKPGPGLGGHCIPIDPFYLTWKAREYGINTRFIELAGDINGAMPDYVINKTILALNSRHRSLAGANILVLGVAYKKNVDDMRESPAIYIMEKLQELGVIISYHDPLIPKFPDLRNHSFKINSVELTPSLLNSYDAILLITDHDAIDYELIKQNANLIIDCRGKYIEKCSNIVSA